MATGLSLLPGGGGAARPAGASPPSRAGLSFSSSLGGGRLALPGAGGAPTLAELFPVAARDAGWAGFLAAQLPAERPWLWIQDRMAILETGRVHPPGLGTADLIHVEARDARAALWAMEEGLRCAAIGAVIGEIWGDPATLDFTATRRLAVAAERHGVAAFLIRPGGHATLSGARFRWRLASAPSLAHPFNPRAPGRPVWVGELFRARAAPPGRWTLAHEPASDGAEGGFHLVASPADRALDQGERRSA